MKVHQTREAFSNKQPQWMYTVKRESLNRPEVNTEMGKVFRKYLVIALSLFEITGIPSSEAEREIVVIRCNVLQVLISITIRSTFKLLRNKYVEETH